MAAGSKMSRCSNGLVAAKAEVGSREDRHRRLEVDRGQYRVPIRPCRSFADELEGTPASTSRPKEQAEFEVDALQAEYAKLEAEYADADEIPEEVADRLEAIEAKLAAFDDRPVAYSIPPRSSAPAPSSASLRTGCSWSIAAMFAPKTKLPEGVDGRPVKFLDDAGFGEPNH